MFEISPCKTNLNPDFDVKIPEPSSFSSVFNSDSDLGCVKSPVPRRLIPLSLAYFSKLESVMPGLVALLNLECICRSAKIFIMNLKNIDCYLNFSETGTILLRHKFLQSVKNFRLSSFVRTYLQANFVKKFRIDDGYTSYSNIPFYRV